MQCWRRLFSQSKELFIKGRWIAENTVLAQEVMHKMKKHKGKIDLMMMKLDLKNRV